MISDVVGDLRREAGLAAGFFAAFLPGASFFARTSFAGTGFFAPGFGATTAFFAAMAFFAGFFAAFFFGAGPGVRFMPQVPMHIVV